ncbi:hypothetical protein SRABI26_03929 [Arthrobacter sp. Bi26]|nr:hypothetical protein SRABI26_03929 [Arthrobacter sp. Bi26]
MEAREVRVAVRGGGVAGEHWSVKRQAQRVGGDDVEPAVADERGGHGDGVKQPPDLGSHLRLFAADGCPLCGPGRPGQFEEVGAFFIVQVQCPGDGFEYIFGDAADVAFLEPRVPFGAHPGEHGDLFASQPRDPPSGSGGEADLVRVELGAAAGQEVPDVGAVVRQMVHTSTVTPVHFG